MNEQPDILAQLEQDQAHLQNVAPLLAKFHDALIEQNFNEEQAMELVRDYFADVIAYMHPEPEDDA